MSIITNFGCHGKCPYCIVRENGIDVPETTLEGLDNLLDEVKKNGCNIVSLSGGGDPLHNYRNNRFFYTVLRRILDGAEIPIEMHTSYTDSSFDYGRCKRVVYHLRDINHLCKVKRHEQEIVRVVFVVTKNMTKDDIDFIHAYVRDSSKIDELSFRQMVDNHYQTTHYNYDYLLEGHNAGKWHYIEQNDYNLYYVNGQVYERFSDIHK